MNELGTVGSEDGQFNTPTGLVIDKGGTLESILQYTIL
jgi:hypothetical protein